MKKKEGIPMKTIITIGREFGSDGREIGEKLAKALNIPFYDKELLSRAAKESGFCEEMIQWHDERPTNSFLYNLVMDTYSFGYNSTSMVDVPISQKIFLAQFETIRKIANEGACVIVGRCADYALDEYDNCLSIFIHGNLNDRIKKVSQKYNLSEQKAKEMIHKTDKQRQSYYNYYTSKKWGSVDTYDLSINSFLFGVDGTVQQLLRVIQDFDSSLPQKEK